MKTGGEFHQAERDVVISTKANCELTVNEKEDRYSDSFTWYDNVNDTIRQQHSKKKEITPTADDFITLLPQLTMTSVNFPYCKLIFDSSA